jgi:hypothetical protein
MCDTCPCDVSSIPGPVDVAARAARNKTARKVAFRGLALPFLAGIIWYQLGWWLVPIAFGLAAMAAGVLLVVRRLHRHVVVAAPTPAQRYAELERRRRNAIPVPAARPALPRGLSITRRRRALPAPARALPAAVVTGKVVGKVPVRQAWK